MVYAYILCANPLPNSCRVRGVSPSGFDPRLPGERSPNAPIPSIIRECRWVAKLRIEWRPRPESREPASFVFHYYDSTGRDFGWHREPNQHVDRLEPFHERDSPDQDDVSEPASFESESPVEPLWDVLGRIEERVWVGREERGRRSPRGLRKGDRVSNQGPVAH